MFILSHICQIVVVENTIFSETVKIVISKFPTLKLSHNSSPSVADHNKPQFVPSKLFQDSLLFKTQARATQSGALSYLSAVLLVNFRLASKNYQGQKPIRVSDETKSCPLLKLLMIA
jgi:hypothetical protein